MFITEALAAGQYLSDYPEDVSYAELCELILQQSEDVTVWEPFEDYPPDWDRECMSNFQELLYHIHYHFSLCISSTWRKFAQTPAEFSAIAARRGLYLPTNYYHEDWRTGFRLSPRPRLYEILEHVEDNKVKNFLILDDDVEHERCPVTGFKTGFTRAALEKAKEILDEQFNRNRN